MFNVRGVSEACIECSLGLRHVRGGRVAEGTAKSGILAYFPSVFSFAPLRHSRDGLWEV